MTHHTQGIDYHKSNTTDAEIRPKRTILGLRESAEAAKGLTSPPKALGFAVDDGEVVVVDEGDDSGLALLVGVGELVGSVADDALTVAVASVDAADVGEVASAVEGADADAVDALAVDPMAVDAREPLDAPGESAIVGHSAPTPPPLKMVPMSVEGSAARPRHCWLTRLATCCTPAAQPTEHAAPSPKSRALQSGSVAR